MIYLFIVMSVIRHKRRKYRRHPYLRKSKDLAKIPKLPSDIIPLIYIQTISQFLFDAGRRRWSKLRLVCKTWYNISKQKQIMMYQYKRGLLKKPKNRRMLNYVMYMFNNCCENITSEELFNELIIDAIIKKIK